MKNKKIVLMVAGALVIAGLSFWGGVKYGQSKSTSTQLSSRMGSFSQNGMGQNIGRTNIRGGINGGMVSGEILSMDTKSVTIKLNDGGSKIVFFSPSTKIEKTIDGVAGDLIVGKQVSVVGPANSDGSVNALSIQMRPTLTQNKPIN